jgi:hypothetical protein
MDMRDLTPSMPKDPPLILKKSKISMLLATGQEQKIGLIQPSVHFARQVKTRNRFPWQNSQTFGSLS